MQVHLEYGRTGLDVELPDRNVVGCLQYRPVQPLADPRAAGAWVPAAGAVVALFSGWDTRVNDSRKFFGLDDKGGFHFPGFNVEAVQFLQEQRHVKGIATDTLSLDFGASADFPAHHYWLGHNKWGLENVAGLDQLPAKGATIVVGGPKIAGCTGGPSRVLALL